MRNIRELGLICTQEKWKSLEYVKLVLSWYNPDTA